MVSRASASYAEQGQSLAPLCAEPITFDVARARLDDFLIRHFVLNGIFVLGGGTRPASDQATGKPVEE